MTLPSVGKFLVFAIIGFWPLGFYFAFLISSIRLNISLNKLYPSLDPSLGLEPQPILPQLVAAILPLLVLLIGYFRFHRRTTWPQRAREIFLTWVAISFILGFLFSAFLGGVSMAVADGVLSGVDLLIDYGVGACIFTASASIAALPWATLVVYLLKRLNSRLHLWFEL